MIKGTINVSDYYGIVQSIEKNNDLHVLDMLINKCTGQCYTILSVNAMVNDRNVIEICYKIKPVMGTFERYLSLDTIKIRFWKGQNND